MKRKPYKLIYEKPYIRQTTWRRIQDWSVPGHPEISTGGYDIGPHVYLTDETDDFVLVYSPSYKAWEGMSMPWSDQPAAYYLCRKNKVFEESRKQGVHGVWINYLVFLATVHPGLYFRQAIEIMRAKMIELQVRMDKKGYSTESEDQMYKIWNEENATKE